MNSKFFTPVLIAAVLWLFANSSVNGQQFTIPFFTIDGGGGYTSNGSFELEGTIGQFDAGAIMSGGGFQVTGGFWAPSTQTSTDIALQSFEVTRGTYFAGGIAELSNSDNSDLSLRRSNTDIQSRTQFDVKAFSPVANPSSMEVALEGSVFARTTVTQSIELFDYVADAWELVDTSPANRFSDSTVTVTPTGDLSRFVQVGTRCIEARIRYQSENPRQQFSSNTDLFSWTIE